MRTIGALALCLLALIVIGIFFLCRNQKGKWRRGFWREFFSRDNSVVNTMAVISLVICAPFAGISIIALIYDIFYLGHGLKDPSVKLISILVSAGAAGLTAGQFSKRTWTEMQGTVPPGVTIPGVSPPGPITRGPKPESPEGA